MFCLSHAQAAERGSSSELNKSGLYYLEKGEPGKASVFFGKALALDPSNRHYCNNMGASLMRSGDYRGSIKYFEQAIEHDPGYARALSNMAVALFHLGRYSDSYMYYLRSMKADSEYTSGRFERGRVKNEIRKISHNRPDDGILKKILRYIDDTD